jgi:hypothetical protein
MKLTEVINRFFAEAEQPVLFAGAGVSARAGLPTWKAYLTTLSGVASTFDAGTKYLMDKQIAEGKLDLAASYFYLCDDIPQATRLVELVAPLENYDSSSLKDLVSLPFVSFATTNFDEAILDAYASARGKVPRLVNIDEPTLDAAPFEKKFYIARIHGRVELPLSMRLSREHFAGLATNEAYKGFLTHIFTRCNVLFVGFSFMDPAIVSVMRAVKATYKNLHGKQHLALLPSDAAAEFIQELTSHDIRKVTYSPNNYHQELWSSIGDALTQLKGVARQTSVAGPFEIAKRYLATAYARMKIGASKGGPLLSVMAEGIVAGLIKASNSSGISEAQLAEKMFHELPVSKDAAQTLVSQSLTALLSEGKCHSSKNGTETRYVIAEVDDSFDRAVDRLVSGTVNRFVVRERGKDSVDIRQFLRKFFIELLLTRGWDLGAAFAARRVPDEVNVFAAMDALRDPVVKGPLLDKLRGAVEDLLLSPDDVEAVLLAEMGRLSFGLELLIQAPRDAEFFERTLPERIYLDANVLMPAITTGHPQKVAMETTIRMLQKYLRGSNASVAVCVFDGFLNEIVSHRRLAIAAMAQRDGEGAMWAEREVSLFGASHVNVYIGAYFNVREAEPKLSFEKFLSRYAPYKDERELRTFLEGLGYLVVSDNPLTRRDYPEILHALEVFYASGLEHLRKSARVISHDAAQLALLSYEMHANKRAVLVSADKRMRIALDQNGFAWLGNAIISHLGLVQLVDLLCGEIDESRSVASLYWMSEVSSNSERIRNHLINLALKHHDAALAMELKDIVDRVAEDASAELQSDDLNLESESRELPTDRVRVNTVMSRYEENFFARMRAEIERREAKLK